jgi:hypothetical protein
MTASVKVAVVIPVYNRKKYVGEGIRRSSPAQPVRDFLLE